MKNDTTFVRMRSGDHFDPSFHKFCLILKDRFLVRFPPNFQERFLVRVCVCVVYV